MYTVDKFYISMLVNPVNSSSSKIILTKYGGTRININSVKNKLEI